MTYLNDFTDVFAGAVAGASGRVSDTESAVLTSSAIMKGISEDGWELLERERVDTGLNNESKSPGSRAKLSGCAKGGSGRP